MKLIEHLSAKEAEVTAVQMVTTHADDEPMTKDKGKPAKQDEAAATGEVKTAPKATTHTDDGPAKKDKIEGSGYDDIPRVTT